MRDTVTDREHRAASHDRAARRGTEHTGRLQPESGGAGPCRERAGSCCRGSAGGNGGGNRGCNRGGTGTREERVSLLRLGFPAAQGTQAAQGSPASQRSQVSPGSPADPARRKTRPDAAVPAARAAECPRRGRVARWLRGRACGLVAEERGAVTAEYALVIMAAVAFAGLLIVIMRSEEVRSMLLGLVQNALGAAG